MPKRLLKKYLELESSGGILLLIMAIIAIAWANSPFAFIHQMFIHQALFGINEGLMVLFFLSVGLELKRGFIEGDLSSFSDVILPAVAALGGMLVPAAIYVYFNHHDPVTINAWATPVATDIAFALAVLSLFGRKVPIALKLFLLALAIFDDIGAILIIAMFYSHGIVYLYVILAIGFMLVLVGLNYFSVSKLTPYLLVGILLWYSLLHSGIHPTIAGVLLALTIPTASHKQASPLHRLEKTLNPWVIYVIMPLFALANAGFSLEGLTLKSLTDHVVLGITLGLFLGKQVGVFTASWLLIRFGWAKLPEKSSWLALYGVALVCGIGFTMSLFLGTLSFQNQSLYLAQVRLGVILGSILSGLVGAMVLFIAFNCRVHVREESIID